MFNIFCRKSWKSDVMLYFKIIIPHNYRNYYESVIKSNIKMISSYISMILAELTCIQKTASALNEQTILLLKHMMTPSSK